MQKAVDDLNFNSRQVGLVLNLIIIEPADLSADHRISLTDRRHDHLKQVLKVQVGDSLTVGVLNGSIGKAIVTACGEQSTQIEVQALDICPPPTLPVKLILGLPRPRMLQRTLQTLATMGVEELHLLQTSRVEKSFWHTPLLQPTAIKEQLILGLEQGKATQLPKVFCHRRFRPFVEDDLPNLLCDVKQKYVAHPGDYPRAEAIPHIPTCLAIGPEGGFLNQEVDILVNQGFRPVQLGERILRVETAIPVLLGKLF